MLSKKGRECADNYSLRETANVRVRERVAIFADCLDVEEREREKSGEGGREQTSYFLSTSVGFSDIAGLCTIFLFLIFKLVFEH